MAKKEQKSSKKAEEAEERDETAEQEDDDAGEAHEAPVRSAAETRRARMRERRSAPVLAHDEHGDHGHAHDHAHGGHGHHEEEEELDTSNDPTWWVPHAVLGSLVLAGILGFFGAFNGLAGKLGYKGMPSLAAAHSAEPAGSAKPASTPAKPQDPHAGMNQQQQPPKEMFGAKHLLVMYKGSMRAPENITRTKDEAKARAEEALKKAKAGTKFEDLVKEYSDEPGAGQRGGDLGKFPKGRMVGPFQDGLEKTKVGGFSDLVETPFGYHVILRTQ
jgi:hypothetical protein